MHCTPLLLSTHVAWGQRTDSHAGTADFSWMLIKIVCVHFTVHFLQISASFSWGFKYYFLYSWEDTSFIVPFSGAHLITQLLESRRQVWKLFSIYYILFRSTLDHSAAREQEAGLKAVQYLLYPFQEHTWSLSCSRAGGRFESCSVFIISFSGAHLITQLLESRRQVWKLYSIYYILFRSILDHSAAREQEAGLKAVQYLLYPFQEHTWSLSCSRAGGRFESCSVCIISFSGAHLITQLLESRRQVWKLFSIYYILFRSTLDHSAAREQEAGLKADQYLLYPFQEHTWSLSCSRAGGRFESCSVFIISFSGAHLITQLLESRRQVWKLFSIYYILFRSTLDHSTAREQEAGLKAVQYVLYPFQEHTWSLSCSRAGGRFESWSVCIISFSGAHLITQLLESRRQVWKLFSMYYILFRSTLDHSAAREQEAGLKAVQYLLYPFQGHTWSLSCSRAGGRFESCSVCIISFSGAHLITQLLKSRRQVWKLFSIYYILFRSTLDHSAAREQEVGLKAVQYLLYPFQGHTWSLSCSRAGGRFESCSVFIISFSGAHLITQLLESRRQVWKLFSMYYILFRSTLDHSAAREQEAGLKAVQNLLYPLQEHTWSLSCSRAGGRFESCTIFIISFSGAHLITQLLESRRQVWKLFSIYYILFRSTLDHSAAREQEAGLKAVQYLLYPFQEHTWSLSCSRAGGRFESCSVCIISFSGAHLITQLLESRRQVWKLFRIYYILCRSTLDHSAAREQEVGLKAVQYLLYPFQEHTWSLSCSRAGGRFESCSVFIISFSGAHLITQLLESRRQVWKLFSMYYILFRSTLDHSAAREQEAGLKAVQYLLYPFQEHTWSLSCSRAGGRFESCSVFIISFSGAHLITQLLESRRQVWKLFSIYYILFRSTFDHSAAREQETGLKADQYVLYPFQEHTWSLSCSRAGGRFESCSVCIISFSGAHLITQLLESRR